MAGPAGGIQAAQNNSGNFSGLRAATQDEISQFSRQGASTLEQMSANRQMGPGPSLLSQGQGMQPQGMQGQGMMPQPQGMIAQQRSGGLPNPNQENINSAVNDRFMSDPRQAQLNQMGQQLGSMDRNSPQFAQLNTQYQQLGSQFNQDMQGFRQGLMQPAASQSSTSPTMVQANQPQQFTQFAGAGDPIVDGNVAQTIANTVGNAARQTAAGMSFQPLNVQAAQAGSQGYTAQNAAAQGYTAERAAAERAAAQGYNAERIAGVGPVTAERVQAGQLAGTSLDPYFNPYENQVVQQSLSDIERQRLMQQNLGGAQAQAAGAFGGSRQGIAEAETNRAFAEQAARTAAGLRQAGFTQAQQAAQQDIATRMQAGLANQATGLQAATTTANLGQQAQMANQAAGNQAAQFGAQAQNVAGLQNAQLGTQANLANQAAMNQASQFGAQAQNVAALQNAAAQNQASQFGAGASNQAALANQQAMMNAQTANQAAGLQAGGQRLQAAGQLANIGNLGFGMVQDVQSSIANAGLQQQAAQQALIDAARGQYGGYTGAPTQALRTQLGAFGGSQTGAQTQTSSRQPGLFDYLQLGASVM